MHASKEHRVGSLVFFAETTGCASVFQAPYQQSWTAARGSSCSTTACGTLQVHPKIANCQAILGS
eukprot:3197730-Amphidinium_carterae.1